jgi:hypothetical protein
MSHLIACVQRNRSAQSGQRLGEAATGNVSDENGKGGGSTCASVEWELLWRDDRCRDDLRTVVRSEGVSVRREGKGRASRRRAEGWPLSTKNTPSRESKRGRSTKRQTDET